MAEPAPEELECVEVVVTAESTEWLADFTRQLVEDRLVACGHNIAPIRAIYRWEGKVYDETQARVGLHTRASLVPEIVARTDRDHADDVPCVISMPISNGNRACLRWVYSETRQRQRNAQGEPELLKSDSMRELFRLATRCTKLADSQSSLDPSERAAIRDELLTSPLYEMIRTSFRTKLATPSPNRPPMKHGTHKIVKTCQQSQA